MNFPTLQATVVLWAARAEIGTGLCDRALRLTLQVLRGDRACAEAYLVRGQATLLSADCKGAKELLKEALRLDPDLEEAKRLFKVARGAENLMARAKQTFNVRAFEQSAELYSKVLRDVKPPSLAPLSSQVLAARGTCFLRLKKFPECLKDVAKALYAQDDCKEAWLTKASALHALGRHDEALEDMAGLMRRWGSGDPSIRHAYERADFEVRKAKRPDFYKIFGVPTRATEGEIKSAYRKLSLQYHPDKQVNKTPSEQQAAVVKFKELGGKLLFTAD